MVDPAVVAVAADFEDRINTGRLNVDENQATAAEYQVWSIPTLALFHDGELVAQQVGVPGNGGDVEIALRNWVESQLSSLAADASIVPEDDAAEADSATESDVVEQAVDLPDVPQGQADDQEDDEGGN